MNLFYLDQEDDEISITNNNDLQIFKEIYSKTSMIQIREIKSFSKQKFCLHKSYTQKQSDKERMMGNKEMIKIEANLKQILGPINSNFDSSLDHFSTWIWDNRPFVICDRCGVQLKQRYYQCIACINFQLCEQCQIRDSHRHPLMKVKNGEKDLQVLYSLRQQSQSIFRQLTQITESFKLLRHTHSFCNKETNWKFKQERLGRQRIQQLDKLTKYLNQKNGKIQMPSKMKKQEYRNFSLDFDIKAYLNDQKIKEKQERVSTSYGRKEPVSFFESLKTYKFDTSSVNSSPRRYKLNDY